MSKKQQWKTAEEIMAEQQRDPEFQRRAAEKLKRRQEREAAHALLEKPVLAELETLGFKIDSVYRLAKTYGWLPKPVVETLLKWVAQATDKHLLEALIRQLAAAKKPFDGTVLAKCFDGTKDPTLQWVIVNTIASAKPHSIDDWLKKLLENAYWKKTYNGLLRPANDDSDTNGAV